MTDLDHAQLALGKVGDLDLLDGNSLTGAPVETLVDGTEGTLADAVSESLAVDPDVSKSPCCSSKRVGGALSRRWCLTYVVLQTGILQGPVPRMATAGVDDSPIASQFPPGGPCRHWGPASCSSSSSSDMVRPLGVGAACPHGNLPEILPGP